MKQASASPMPGLYLSWADTETLLVMLAEAAQVRLDKQKA